MKLAWLSDIHVDFLSDSQLQELFSEVKSYSLDAILITGDISDSRRLENDLQILKSLSIPIFFVLGNHDYYYSRVYPVKKKIETLAKNSENLVYLSDGKTVELIPSTLLVGQDGWADGRYDSFKRSLIELNDYYYIKSFEGLPKQERIKVLQSIADKEARKLQNTLRLAVIRHPKRIVVATHVPPFRELCLDRSGKIDPQYVPHFSSKATGDVLLDIANENPDIEFLCLCGHTHTETQKQILQNLEVRAAYAKRGTVHVQEIIEI